VKGIQFNLPEWRRTEVGELEMAEIEACTERPYMRRRDWMSGAERRSRELILLELMIRFLLREALTRANTLPMKRRREEGSKEI
jgi:hypothetical protein